MTFCELFSEVFSFVVYWQVSAVPADTCGHSDGQVSTLLLLSLSVVMGKLSTLLLSST